MTVKEAAKSLGISPALCYALLAAHKIRHERHGLGRGKIIIPPEALDEYRQRCTVPIEDEPTSDPPPAPESAGPRRQGPGIDLW